MFDCSTLNNFLVQCFSDRMLLPSTKLSESSINFFLLVRCCCGRLMGEHSWQESVPPVSLYPGPGHGMEENWSMGVHTKASPTNAYGIIDFQDTATRVCRAKVCDFTGCTCQSFKRKKTCWIDLQGFFFS